MHEKHQSYRSIFLSSLFRCPKEEEKNKLKKSYAFCVSQQTSDSKWLLVSGSQQNIKGAQNKEKRINVGHPEKPAP